MLFSRIALFVFPAIAAAVVLPRCDSGCSAHTSQYCCNQVQRADSLSDGQKQLVSLAGFQLDNVIAQFGFTCAPIAAAPIAGAFAGCKSYNVCCQNSTATGVVAMNCSPIIL